MHPVYKIHTNPLLMGVAIGQTFSGFFFNSFESFTFGMVGLSCLYTAWWIEKKYYPEYKGEDV